MKRTMMIYVAIAIAALFNTASAVNHQRPGSLWPISVGPDLVILPRPGGVGEDAYCNRNANGELVITIKNQGRGGRKFSAAGSSVLKVQFGVEAPRLIEIPAIAPNSTYNVAIKMPSACFDPDCSFTIRVDAKGSVKEINEANNTVRGRCIG